MKEPKEKPEPLHTLLSRTIAQHMRIIQQANRDTNWYFRSQCRFVKALEEHIISAGPKTCVIDKEDRRISFHRGTGAAIDVNNPVFHMGFDGEPDSISFELHVGYEPLPDDAEYTGEHNRDVERLYHMNISVDLEENFTKEKFDLWKTATRAKRLADRNKTEHKLLEKMMRRHAEKAIEFAAKLKKPA